MNIKLELQHFNGCPHAPILRERVHKALESLPAGVAFIVTLVESDDDARRLGFLGSPTLLLDGEDWEGRAPRGEAHLACRYYPNGLPTPEEIIHRLKAATNESRGGSIHSVTSSRA